mgnify:FL=1
MDKNNKSKRTNLRWKEDEIQFVKNQAEMCNMSMSEYIRRCSLNEEKIVIVDPDQSIALSLGKIYSVLSNHDELTVEDKMAICSGLSGVVDTLHKVIEELQ